MSTRSRRQRGSARYRFSQGTFARTRGNGRDAPILVALREGIPVVVFDPGTQDAKRDIQVLVGLQLHAPACNLGNFMQTPAPRWQNPGR